MSSDADSPRQRTVAELLAAHGGDTAVTGRRARRRAAEDAADGAPAVVDAPVGNPVPQPAANGNAANGSSANGNYGNGAQAPYRNGSPAPSVNGAEGYGGDPFINGGVDPAYVAPVNDNRGAPYVNGSADPMGAPDGPYANGAGGRYVNGGAVRGGDGPGAPYVNGNGDTTYSGPRPGAPNANRPDAGPYVNGNGAPRGNRGAPAPRSASRNPRRGAGLPDEFGQSVPESDAPFVNGGAVYADTEAITSRGAPWTPDRSVLREPVPRDLDAPAEPWSPPSAEQARARPTEEMPRLRSDRTPMLDPGMTGPIDMQRLPQADDLDEGPSTAVGMAPVGAEDWHRERTGRRRSGSDAGPPTEASADPLSSFDDPPAGLDEEPGRRRTSPDVGKSTGQAWAAVVAQWIAGAIGGAALWVGFRFLWRDLPVVALAAAALVTVGLVLVVRALMHNDDRRTTLFAVLVGLLLTVSPAILVLLGR
jgi:hypothetical protein